MEQIWLSTEDARAGRTHNSMNSQQPAISRSVLENLLAEEVGDARRRAQQTFDTLAGPFGACGFLFCGRGLCRRLLECIPHHVLEQKEKVLQAFDLCADEESRREYLAQVRWRLHFDCDGLPAPGPGPIYFPPGLVRLGTDEVFVDCGAFDGDTVNLFLRE